MQYRFQNQSASGRGVPNACKLIKTSENSTGTRAPASELSNNYSLRLIIKIEAQLSKVIILYSGIQYESISPSNYMYKTGITYTYMNLIYREDKRGLIANFCG
jgi:hypothetical protein